MMIKRPRGMIAGLVSLAFGWREIAQPPTPLGALFRGLVAGGGGTALMTTYQRLVQRGEDVSSNEPKSERERWEQASAPAQMAKGILEGVFREDVSADRIPRLTAAMHWLYRTSLGAVYGLVQGTIRANPLAAGLACRGSAWAFSYAQLVPMGINEPPWRYPARLLAVDFSDHVVYGLGVAGDFEAAYRL